VAETEQQRIQCVEHTIYGNGQNGLIHKASRLEDTVYHDPVTRTPGLHAQVRDHAELIISTRATLRTLNHLLGLFGVGAPAWLVRALFRPIS
jgi:hypothetical protein